MSSSLACSIVHHLVCTVRDAPKEFRRGPLARDDLPSHFTALAHPSSEDPAFAPADKPSVCVSGCRSSLPIGVPAPQTGPRTCPASNNLFEDGKGWLNAFLWDHSDTSGFQEVGAHMSASVYHGQHASWRDRVPAVCNSSVGSRHAENVCRE